MNLSAERRLAVVWLVTVGITLIYLLVDQVVDEHGVLRSSVAASVAAIVLALVKLRIILREFMDVRHAPKVLRVLTDALAIVMAVFLLGTYLVGTAAQ